MIDIHSHILPGVDDGARSLADSVDLMQELASAGITDVIATPHYVPETKYVSNKTKNLLVFQKLKRTLVDKGAKTRIFLGNEVYIDKSVADLASDGIISTLAGGSYLLVELPLNGTFPHYEDIILDLIGVGYKVILAHPERYVIVQKDYEILRELWKAGVLIQCNLGSIMGEYGKGAKKMIKKLLRDDMIFALGSDIHYCHGVDYWVKAQKKITKYTTAAQAKRIFEANPRKILG